jgi:hypothetical protein
MKITQPVNSTVTKRMQSQQILLNLVDEEDTLAC